MPETQRGAEFPFLSGGGELARLIGEFDWNRTSLGPISSWPQSVKTTTSLILRSKVPIVTLWGTDGVMIYNDAYSVFAGGRHPGLLGSRVREGWPEVAGFNDNVMKVGLAGGTLSYTDQELTLFRFGRPEQVWMNLDYSPILNEEGVPAGVMAIVVETTTKVAAEAWRNGEIDRQRQMFDQAPSFMAMLSGPDHVFEITNAAYIQLIGHRDVIGKTVREALPELEGQQFFQLLDQVFETGEAFVGTSLKASIQRTPGCPVEERYIDFIYQPIRNPGGSVMGIFVQGVDVTDRLKAESAVRQSEARFRAFAEAMPHHVWTAKPDGLLDWFNPRVYEYSGALPGDLDGQGWASIVHADDLQAAADNWGKALAIGQFYETEFRLRRQDGSYRWHIARAVPIRGGDDAILQWIGTNTDIDDQKRVAEALAESERRLELSQNAAGIGSLELDIASGTVIGSARFWDLWGLSQRDSVHISVLEGIVIPEDKDIRSNPETRAKGTAVTDVEYRIRRPDTGELRWLSRSIEFQHDRDGKPIKMFGAMQDITDRKEAQSRQQMLTHELEHRIKNILAMVGAIATQTLKNSDIDTARAAFTSRLAALGSAHDNLTATRWTDASLRQVVEKTVAAFRSERVEISGPAVSISSNMALSLALAINELGTNAIKYGALSTPEGCVSIDWSVSSPDEGKAAEFSLRWKESGGPLVQPPTRRGFGTFLIDRVLAADFSGTVRIDYAAAGVECVLTAPASVLKSGQ